MFLLSWTLILVYFGHIGTGYVEIVEITTCDSCAAMLTCRDLSSVVAILEVEFSPDSSNETFLSDNTTFNVAPFPPMHPRDCINHRCSGVNHCSFILSEDCPESELLGQGNLTIKYACISEDRIGRYCNSDIVLHEKYSTGSSVGFLHNPGYPRFYSGQKQCKWTIRVRADQRIRISVLDISLIVDNVASPADCTDVLEVRDTGQVIYSTCRLEHPPKEIISASESIEVVLIAKNTFNPRRGVFVRYSVVGCPELPIPQDAYLVFRNDQLTVLSCCLGYHFPDTDTRIKYVRCIGASWNTTLPIPSCQKSPVPTRSNRTRDLQIRERKAQAMSTELLPPLLIILTLFIINGVVLFYIQRAKKRQEDQNVRDEELGSFTLSPTET